MSVAIEPDVEELLRPISADQPVGVDPRNDSKSDSDWRELRERGTTRSAHERDAVDNEQSPLESRANWRKVCELAKRILSSEAKDVEAACYLVEGWVRLDEFAGLARGLSMLTGLMKEYGNNLFPQPSDGAGPAERFLPIEPLVRPVGGHAGTFAHHGAR